MQLFTFVSNCPSKSDEKRPCFGEVTDNMSTILSDRFRRPLSFIIFGRFDVIIQTAMVEKSLDWDVFVHRGLALCKSVFFFRNKIDCRRNILYLWVGGLVVVL